MQQITFTSILFIGAMVLAFGMIITAITSIHMASRWPDGVLQYFFYALFISNGLMLALSGRNLSGLDVSDPAVAVSPLTSWSIRLTSLFLMLAALDQCVRFFKTKPHIEPARALLMGGILFLWLTNVMAPALWSTHPVNLVYQWFYQLILIIGLTCLTAENGTAVIRNCRNAALAFCLASLVAAAVNPSLAINLNYQRGLMAGWPRLTGLATHPITMGMISASTFWCIIYAPFQSKKINAASLLVCVVALLLSQSKTTWVGFLMGLPVLILYRVRAAPRPRDRRITAIFATGYGAAMLLAPVLLTLAVLAITDGQVDKFTHSDLGIMMFSLTGRDAIWDIALEEWRRSPIFGYGLELFDLPYRVQIGMLFATDGHNQIYDALARSGVVGATGCIIYCSIIAWLGVRYSRASKGLSLILAISMLVRMVSEVPLILTVTNLNDTAHYLFICVIMSCMRRQPAQQSSQRTSIPNRFPFSMKPG